MGHVERLARQVPGSEAAQHRAREVRNELNAEPMRGDEARLLPQGYGAAVARIAANIPVQELDRNIDSTMTNGIRASRLSGQLGVAGF